MRTKVFQRENHYESVLAFLNNHCLEEKLSDITFICRLLHCYSKQKTKSMISRKDLKHIHAHSCLLKNISGLIREFQPLLEVEKRIYITLAEHIGGSTLLKLLQFIYLGWWS